MGFLSWDWGLVLSFVGVLGVGGTLLVVAGFVFGWPIIVGTRIGRWALFAFGLVVAGLVVFAKGKSAGVALERARLEKRIAKKTGDAKVARDQVKKMTDEQVKEGLSKWDAGLSR